jgi:hypothetical protein
VIDLSHRPELLDPDAPVHPPAGMTVEECLAYRARLRELQRQDALGEAHSRRAARGQIHPDDTRPVYRIPSRVELHTEERDRLRIEAAEDRREGRDDPR